MTERTATDNFAPWDPARLPKPTRDAARLRADMDDFGYCLIAEALTADQIARASDRLLEQAEAERARGIRAENAPHIDLVNQWVPMLINKGAVFAEIAENPRTLPLVEHMLGREFLLSVLEAHIVRRGGSAMALHVDQWWMPHPVAPDARHPRPGDATRTGAPTGPLARARGPIWPPMVVNCMHMLTDFTEANGATRVVPTSHLSGVQPSQALPHPVPTVPAEGPAGTAVVFEGRMWHAAGRNLTATPRLGVTGYYAAPMCRQLTNFTVGVTDEVLARATPRLKALLGFKVWSTYGGIDDHAAEYIERDAPRVGELRS